MPAAEAESSPALLTDSVSSGSRSARSTWIISPAVDLALLIASPLAIVPLTLLVARRSFTVEQISLFVLAFASIGHQLPGFLRAYGDAELFARFKWRMLLGPPIVLVAAWLVARTEFHGLVLLLLLWSTWHVLMQTYGMLRIYDLKHGWGTRGRARLDFWACIALFAGGFVGSESRLFILAETAWRVGLPMPTPAGFAILRWTIAGGALGMLALYLVGLVAAYRANRLVWVKPVLLLSTGVLYWLCGTPAIPVLLGVAMFEVFHAIQYDALVWSYDRKLGAKIGNRMGPLRRVFEGRASFLLIYLLAIGLFGALRFLPETIVDSRMQTWLLAAITASTVMHFYFDGFIWKVGAAPPSSSAIPVAERARWDVPHALKCAGLGLIVGGLLILEFRGAPTPAEEANWLADAAVWAPDVPDVQSRLSRAQVTQGDLAGAIESARRAIKLQPDAAAGHADLGAIYLRVERSAEAVEALTEAVRLEPSSWQNAYDLGLGQTQAGNWSEAERAFANADRASPHNARTQRAWAELELARGDAPAAAARLRELVESRNAAQTEPGGDDAELRRRLIAALSAAGMHDQAVGLARRETERDADSSLTWSALGTAFNAAGQYALAIAPLSKSIAAGSSDPNVYFQLGLAQLQSGDRAEAERLFRLALNGDPRHAAAWFQRGNIAYMGGDLISAEQDYRNCVALKPRWAEAQSNLGAVLFALQNYPAAADAYRAALRLAPDNAQANYNLGLLLMLQDDLPQARRYIERAAELGQPCSPEVAEKLGLDPAAR